MIWAIPTKNNTADNAVMLHNLQERLFSDMRWITPCNISRWDWTAGDPGLKESIDNSTDADSLWHPQPTPQGGL